MSENLSNHPPIDERSMVDFLRKSRLFASFPDTLVQQMTPLFSVFHLPESSEILKEGESSGQIFFLIRGQIAVYARGQLILKLRRIGDMCGEMSFITDKPNETSEIADTPVSLLGLEIKDITDNPKIDKDQLINLLYQLFSTMLVDKLTLTCREAEKHAITTSELVSTKKMLSRSMEEAKKADKVKTEFLANISHEIRTPMHGVLGMTSLLLNTELTEQQREFAQIIEKTSNAFLEVINRVLDFSSLRTGEVEIQLGALNIEEIIGNVLLEFQETIKNKGLATTVKLDTKIPTYLRGDSLRLYQVLMNLTGNAVKFTKKGSVSVGACLKNESENSAIVTFSVTDTGIGIRDEDRHLLFRSFSQVDSSLSREYNGTGLGLVISKQLVEIMGGKISFTSTFGEGSTFSFTLEFEKQRKREQNIPATSHSPEKTDPSRDTALNIQRKTKVLLVEDDKVNQVVAVSTLEKLGYNVEIATTGVHALELLRKRPYELILMDIQLPEMDGLEATKIIRGSGKKIGFDPDIPIIAMTAHTLSNNRQTCLNAGMDDYLVKPIVDSELDSVLKRCLFQRSSEKTRAERIHQPTINKPIDNYFITRLKESVGEIEPLITLFLKELPTKLETIAKSVREKDPAELERSARLLKSNCITFGAISMANTCMKLEKLGNSEKLRGSSTLITQLQDESERVTQRLKEML